MPLRQPANQDCIKAPRFQGHELTGSLRIPATNPLFHALSGATPTLSSLLQSAGIPDEQSDATFDKQSECNILATVEALRPEDSIGPAAYQIQLGALDLRTSARD
jgi:hypothetical protein